MNHSQHAHRVQFYETEQFLYETVAGFVHEGLATATPVIIVATKVHRDALRARLTSAGYDFDRAVDSGDITSIDVHEALEMFMVDAQPDEHRFRAHFGGLLERTARGRPSSRIRVCGEAADVLWQQGQKDAALREEELWNELIVRYGLDVLCTYSMAGFPSSGDAHALASVCRCHDQVTPSETYTPKADDTTRAREIVMLQHAAVALEREIQTREQLEQTLRHALNEMSHAKEEAQRAHRVKSEFLSVMSHELRTPLNTVIGYHDLLAHEIAGPLTPQQHAYLARLKMGAEQLARLVDQVLNLARIEAGKEELDMDHVEVASLVRECIELVSAPAMKKGLSLTGTIESAPLIAVTDQAKARQILLSLLSNAIKFTDAGGVEVRASTTANSVAIEVRDSGIGIAASELQHIFEPFVQVHDGARERGTGLGLSVSHQLAKLLGGDITAVSVPGKGTAFTLQLPAAAMPAARPDAHAQAKL